MTDRLLTGAYNAPIICLMKIPSERFAMNLTKQDRELIGKLAKRLDVNFREAIRSAVRNEYIRVEQAAYVEKVRKAST